MTEPVKIAIIMEGGCIQAVLTAGVSVQAVVVDYDIEGAEIERVATVMHDDGQTSEAYLGLWSAERAGRFVLDAMILAESMAHDDE